MEGYFTRSRVSRTQSCAVDAYDYSSRSWRPFAASDAGMDRTTTMSWRTTPSDDDVFVPSTVADPYAYFLRFDPGAYRAALAARGTSTDRDLIFDQGHAYSRIQHSVMAKNELETLYGNNEAYSIGVQRFRDALITGYDPSSIGPYRAHGTGFPDIPSDGLAHFAQTAISKTAPSYVAFDLARFLGELREGLPRIMLGFQDLRSKTQFFRSLGSSYLNFQFGWLPFLNDLYSLIRVLTDTSEVLANLPLFGNQVRRHFRLPLSFASEFTPRVALHWTQKVLPGDSGGNASGSVGEGLMGSLSKSMTTSYNFVGSYTRFLPIGFRPDDYVAKLDAFTRTEITPSTLWQLSPWTWLIDWALSLQSTLDSNQLASDESLFIHYAYASYKRQTLTRTDIRPRSFEHSASSNWGRGAEASTLVSTTWKTRVRANPYGFTVGGLDGLQAGQAAILAALGMSRLR